MADTLPPNVVGDEGAVACPVLEIIGGITAEVLQSLEEPCQETDVWSVEEGDDSVFYSDEDTPHRDVTTEPRRPVNSETDETQQREDGQDAEEKETDEEEILHTAIEQDLESANSKLTNLESTCEEAVHVNNSETEHTLSNKAEEKDLTANLEDFLALPEQPVASNHHHQPLEVYRDSEKSCSVPRDQDPSQGRSTLPLSKKKSSHPKSFNHLTSSKYSTVSYRRIRRGNTREKIEEFEYMIMNL